MSPPGVVVVGLGKMGSSMARHLSRSSYEVFGYNRSKREEFDSLPFTIAHDLEALVEPRVVVLSLFDEASSRGLLLNGDELSVPISQGSTVIDTTTHSPEFARFLSRVFQRNGIPYLDAPVSGGPEKAAQGELTIMVGGEPGVFNQQLAILETLGSEIFYLGRGGSGQAAKLVNQLLVGVSQVATAEAMSLARSFGLDMETLVSVITRSAGDSAVFRRSAPQMMEREYSGGFQTELIAKDLREIALAAERGNLALPLSRAALSELSLHSAGEFGSVDAASIFERFLDASVEGQEKP